MNAIKTFLRNFREDTRGSVAVEAALIIPMLLWTYMAVMVFFDAYRMRTAADKAAYTIGDMLSRETNFINSEYLSSAHKLFDLMAPSDNGSAIRVTVVRWSGEEEEYSLEWSEVSGTAMQHDANSVSDLTDSLPVMSAGEVVIVVETFSEFDPPMDVGLTDMDIETFVFTSPRFAPNLYWNS